MSKNNKPNSDEEVFVVMQDYCKKKGYLFSDAQLRFMAENCYLLYESKGWCGVKYWPPLAMKWVLNEMGKFSKKAPKYKKSKPSGKSVRDKIMESEAEQENETTK